MKAMGGGPIGPMPGPSLRTGPVRTGEELIYKTCEARDGGRSEIARLRWGVSPANPSISYSNLSVDMVKSVGTPAFDGFSCVAEDILRYLSVSEDMPKYLCVLSDISGCHSVQGLRKMQPESGVEFGNLPNPQLDNLYNSYTLSGSLQGNGFSQR